MTHPDGRRIGRLLDTVVPDLPAPPNRLAAIERSIRRRRVRLALLAAGLLALVMVGVPALVTNGRSGTGNSPAGPRRPDAGNCPAQLPNPTGGVPGLPKSAPGLLAPVGAVRATMCRYAAPPRFPYRPGPARELILTRDIAGLVTALNRLPVEEPLDPCISITIAAYLTLAYKNGTTVTIEFSHLCGYVRRGDVTRYDGGLGVQAFDERYRQQELAAAVPGSVTPADCTPRLVPTEEPGKFSPEPVLDVWLYTHGADRRYVPAPAAVVTACRYVRADDGLDLTRQVSSRALAREAADAIEAAYLTELGQIPFLDCPPGRMVRTVDVLVLRDVVGETIEVQILRDSCHLVILASGAAPPNTAVLAVLDRLLGPPAYLPASPPPTR